MHLPTFPRAMPVTRRVQTDFRGYDHRPGCPEGGIYEMTNGSAADAPLFSTRPGRTLTYPTGGGSANGLFAVDGGLLWCTGQTLYFNGTPVDGCTLVNGPKVFAELGGTVLIWPDKVLVPAGYGHVRQRRAELERHGGAPALGRQQRRARRFRRRQRHRHALSRGRRRDVQRLFHAGGQRHLHHPRHRGRGARVRPRHVLCRRSGRAHHGHAAHAPGAARMHIRQPHLGLRAGHRSGAQSSATR